MPDFALPADIPLGPFEGTLINVHAAKGKSARVHADRSCSALRTKDVRSLTLPLNAETIGRMCRQCAVWRRWARPGTALDIFLQAVTGMGLSYELDTHSAPDEEDWPEEEVAAAALLLCEGDRPPGEDDDEDRWPEFEKARTVRQAVFQRWTNAAESLNQALAVVGRYPWLEPWARTRLARKSEYVEASRVLAARFCRPEALLAATAVFQAPDPDLPAEDPAFSVLGDAATVQSRLQRLWRRWKERAAADWLTPDQHSSLTYDLEEGIQRKYKQLRVALARGTELVTEWSVQAQSQADRQPEYPERPILARVPEAETSESGFRGDFEEAVTHWDLAVLAAYTVEADWGRRTMLLHVPAVIGERLLAGGSALVCEPGDDGLPAPPDIRATDELLTPGVLDDTPVVERRPIPAAHLRTLRAAGGLATDQLAIVASVENGVEVLPVSVIEERCAAGWRGVFIAGASDLPASLIAPWMERITAADAAAPEREWAPQHLSPRDPDFARHLGAAAGEAWLQTMLSASYYSHGERERTLRCLALARNVHDLRTLNGSIDPGHRAVPTGVWEALLAADGLDLQPFQQEDETKMWGGGIGAPLGVLADVQIYTTNADPAVMGKGHSPYCSHAHGRDVTEYDDLLTAADLLRREDFDWCSKCGGYAVRRLTDVQLDYYRAAHRLHSIAQRLRQGFSRAEAEEKATIHAELEALRKWRPEKYSDWHGGETWRWQGIARDLSAQARRIASAEPETSTGGNVVRFPEPDEQR
ncbi:hypothetical protein [Actinomadura madurae]|uniref:hypothetical protein n=1 Tax=Actinomadura madurae TaxID=1993 RepID=UPI000D871A6C|nr:hypothetical protein [Actinomadura madurae]SPT60099.1 Uncharacterised protein [Actinomadura madurae]